MALGLNSSKKNSFGLASPQKHKFNERALIPSVRAPGVAGEVLGQKMRKHTFRQSTPTFSGTLIHHYLKTRIAIREMGHTG